MHSSSPTKLCGLIALLVLFISPGVRAEKAGPEQCFSYPAAVLRIEGVLQGKLKPAANFSRENAPDAKYQFRGSVVTADKITMSWEFITRSDYGDIYVITFSAGETKEAIALLFDGAKRAEVSRHGLKVSLSSD